MDLDRLRVGGGGVARVAARVGKVGVGDDERGDDGAGALVDHDGAAAVAVLGNDLKEEGGKLNGDTDYGDFG